MSSSWYRAGVSSSPAPASPPRRADALRNEELIRRAAIEAFHGRGLDTPLEQIAAAAGVAKGTIYHRFGGRQGLVDAVIGELVGAEMDRIAEVAERTADPWEALAGYIRDRRDLHYREPAAVDALLASRLDSAALRGLAERASRTSDGLIRRARDAGVLRADFTTPDLYHADVGNGLALRRLPLPTPADYARRTRIFLDGLRPPGHHPTGSGLPSS